METATHRARYLVALFLLVFFALHPSPASAVADEGPYILRLERGDSIQVLGMQPATFGMFRYVRVDSVRRYVAGYRIRSISDTSGRDVTPEVVGHRRAIGVDPLAYRPDPKVPRTLHRDRLVFPIFEVGVYGRLNGSEPYEGDHGLMTGLDFGVMRNLSRSTSAGATVHLEAEDDRTGLGLALRGRRWLSDQVSVDGSAGWIFAGDDERGEFEPYAFYGEAAVNLRDRLQLAARIESWRWNRLNYDQYGYGLNSRQETLIQVGGRVGVFPGVPIFIIFLLGAGIDEHPVY